MTTNHAGECARPSAAVDRHAPAWFRNAVIDGLQGLVTLMLPGTPAAEVVQLTTLSWVEVLWRLPVGWLDALDTPRIGPGFLALAGAIDRWPAPRQLLDHLPPRRQPAASLPAPHHTQTAAQRAALMQARRRVHDHAAFATQPKPPPPDVGESIGQLGSPTGAIGAINGGLDGTPESGHHHQVELSLP